MDLDLAPSVSSRPYATPVAEELARLGSDGRDGLTETDAAARLAEHGPNVLPEEAGDPVWRRALRQLADPLIYVLLAAAATTLVLREYVDASVIAAVVLVNATVGFAQETRALAALAGLRSLALAEARVVRDGRVRTVGSADLVVGDLVALQAGEKVPADLRLVDAVDVRVDESALTGESDPVAKADAVLASGTRVADRSTMLHAGTLVRTGTAHGLVVATGEGTELGAIHRLVSSATPLATPLSRKLARFGSLLTVVIVALAAVTFLVGLLRGEDAPTMFAAAVALAVGAIPEALPAAVTVVLAIGVTRLVRRRAVVRRLPAVETLGGTTVVCTDKTGTLTTNQMTVRAIWTPEATYDVSGAGYDPRGEVTRDDVVADPARDAALRWSLTAGSLCNDAGLDHDGSQWLVTGDPTEGAMKVVALKTDVAGAAAERFTRAATIPFDARRPFMATLHEAGDLRAPVVLVKGAVEQVAALCLTQMGADGGTQPLDHAVLSRAVDDLAARGLRVLATAVDLDGSADGFTADGLPGTGLVLTGLQAMLDPPRPAAAGAIAACLAAGIEVKMITGDHAATAAAVAAELHLDPRAALPGVMTGAELAALDEDAYRVAVSATRVFARVAPEEKLRLVTALQAQGHVVAMTGDGVNDAPALRRADIGIAMGLVGTEVAKDAADMVLLDDDFATIEAAVEEGRGVFDNLVKFILWTLPTNMGEGLVILVAVLLGTALPILPTQILWINMTTAVLLGLTLAFEPREPGVMRRPPRAPDRPLLTGPLVWRTVLVAGLLVAASSWVFSAEIARGAGLDVARTAAVTVFVLVEITYLVSCRSQTRASWRLGLLSNPWVVGGILVQLLAQAAFTYLPVMNTVFGTAPLDAGTWARVLAVTAAVTVVIAADKAWAVRRGAPAAVR
ncbi:HAD-IC family P-type ATPase [Nocardioides sp. AX2bis]|uniref:HAD-IC family P-type ATPase n=1 Tax=Nocardioides sp. AX2bis TaxID=2653157 RepID=UPI0012F41E31|nr:HAD-IC family P-type ATPase [Nocardioides sp. AX2bis]VXC46217.1 putative cation-transporting ATPase F [Nocardioides sp. AX2bis]